MRLPAPALHAGVGDALSHDVQDVARAADGVG